MDKELVECTFKPKTNKKKNQLGKSRTHDQNYPFALPTTECHSTKNQLPKGYDKVVERMRQHTQ